MNTYKRNLLIGFGVSLVVLLVTAVVSFINISGLLESVRMVNHTNEVIKDIESIISTLKDAETGQRGYLITNDTVFLEPYYGATEEVMSLIEELKVQTRDNPDQRVNLTELESIAIKRLDRLKMLVEMQKAGNQIDKNLLRDGRTLMIEVRRVIRTMINEEQKLLEARTEVMNRFTNFTPILLVVASTLAVIITIVFYVRIRKDFEERVQLHQQLQQKDEDISKRIGIIRNIAEQVSEGEYKIRVNDEEKDHLGSLGLSLNKMAQSLEYSFGLLSDKEWLQTGVAGLSDTMMGEKDIETLTYDITHFLVQYTKSNVGALYLLDNKELYLQGSVALHRNGNSKFKMGEGIIGQCAQDGKEVVLNEIPVGYLSISLAEGEVKPNNVVVIPIHHDNIIKGVIELGSLHPYTPRDIELLKHVSYNIGIGINSSQSRKQLQELLEETQAQAEELQSQHTELELLNAEMESHTQKLQASEEELKVQQEELLQANQELEERTRMLEEKNQIINERNYDIQKKAEQLALSTKYKSEFLANMSHELRTPLNSILLLSRLLSENPGKNLTPDQTEYAMVIQSSGHGLLNLIDEILDLSKIEAGKMSLEYNHIEVAEIMSDMRALFVPLAKEKNLDLKINVKEGAPSSIYTDKQRLEQILKNLLSNALKFTTKGYVSLEIAPAEIAPFVNFIVKDTGIGIPSDKQQLVFEAFQQADGSTRRKYGGTGLGLSISRELTRLLGGEIKLSSEVNVGAEFIVSIPATKLSEEPSRNEVVTKEDNIPYKENSTPLTNGEEKRKKLLAPVIPASIDDDRQNVTTNDKIILIVEDDTHFASALLNFTHQRGYKGVVAVRGDDAIIMAKEYNPTAILLDIVLPVKDGWEVMEELKSNPHTRHIPVHIMSSMEVKRESLLKGAVDYINKPVTLDQMQKIFITLEEALVKKNQKVVIVEENAKHAKALSYFLENFNITTEIATSVKEGAKAIDKKEVNCVILDSGALRETTYETLELIKGDTQLQNLPVIVFTGKHLSKTEESRIRQYADSIVVKTAQSYQRILDEVALFLHLVEEKQNVADQPNQLRKLGAFNEVLKNKKVLIADDDVRNIYSITKVLENYKMKVFSAIDGKEAVQQLEINPDIDVVLLDMMMPEMDGYEAASFIRKKLKFKDLPILAVTAKAMAGDREKCIKAGASDYITKPLDMDQLISLLRVWLYDK